MTDVACFCGRGYSFSGEVGVCPQCGEQTTFSRVTMTDPRQMRVGSNPNLRAVGGPDRRIPESEHLDQPLFPGRQEVTGDERGRDTV